MAQLRIMGASGDNTVTWAPDEPGEVAAAKKRATEVLDKGFALYKVDPSNRDADCRIYEFDQSAERIIAVPPMVGG